MQPSIEFIDISQLNPTAKGFSGAVYDGQRYLYFIPMMSGHFYGQVARYDTQRELSLPSSWAFFDTAAVNSASCGFVDGFFDGRYLYMVPYHNQQGHHGELCRYDTTVPFESRDGWHWIDLESLHAGAKGYISGAFAAGRLYLSPYQQSWSRHHGLFASYDTRADFSGAGWHFFDAEANGWPEARGYHSAVVVGEQIVFVPYVREGRDYHGLVMVYDPNRGEFESAASWRSVDISRFNRRGRGFVGGAFDGRYLYLSPYFDGEGRYGQIARYDTHLPLESGSSWDFFDTATLQPDSRGFFGALYHEGDCYFIPHCLAEGRYHGQISRYHCSLAFDDPAAWHFCDTATLHSGSRGYIGGAIVGDALYMAPFETAPGAHTGLVARVGLHNSDDNGESVWQSAVSGY
ncbi:hypothetical protein D5085_17330 [Ectothiorhodospiraceae bacterium BW-2]|nr:hypothetical protein D5085_17330 [Ectothiorhodospiraceae bacterium BW-2]